MKPNRLIAIALAAIFVLALAGVAQACPGCADAQAGQGADRANIVRGYFWSIVFMMSMPFLLIGSFGTYCYLNYRKLKAAAAAQPTPSTLADAAESPAPSTSERSREPALTGSP